MTLNYGVLRKKTFNRLVWDYKNVDYDMFRGKLKQASWENCFSNNNINDIADSGLVLDWYVSEYS